MWLNAEEVSNVAQAIKDASGGGAHVSIDALGSTTTCLNSIGCLRKRGRHVQVGLMVDEHQAPPIPMGQVIANELEILGSHGMQSYKYEGMLSMIISGKLNPKLLIGRTVSLKDSLQVLVTMGNFSNSGVTVIDRFALSKMESIENFFAPKFSIITSKVHWAREMENPRAYSTRSAKGYQRKGQIEVRLFESKREEERYG